MTFIIRRCMLCAVAACGTLWLDAHDARCCAAVKRGNFATPDLCDLSFSRLRGFSDT
jgi:hypothetical protein